MRIFTLDRDPSSKNGGQEWSLLEECLGLAARGHEVTLGHIRNGDFLERYRSAGVRTLQIRDVELLPGERLGNAARFVQSVLRARATRMDVVTVNQYHDTLFGRSIATLNHVPLVCHLRLMPPEGSCLQWRIGLAGVRRFIAASKSVRDAWAQVPSIDANAIDVVYDGIDVNRFRPRDDRARVRHALGAPDDAFVVVYAGRIDRMKNIDQLMRAVSALALPPEKVRLWIAGGPVHHASPEEGNRYLASLKNVAASLGIAGQVNWLGPRADVHELLAAADAAALFSDHEAFGRATVEALASGIPIAANRVGGASEILTGEFARFAFDLAQPEEPVEKLRSFIGLRDRDPGFAARAHQHVVDNFSTAAMVEGIERSLQSVIAGRGA